MTYKSLGKTLIIVLITILTVDSLSAQRRTRSTSRDDNRTRTTREREPKQDDMASWYAISMGTTGFGGGFSLSGKFSYALKYKNRVSVGAFGKAFYDLVSLQGPDVGLFSYGGGAFARLNITDDIFLHGEYNYTDFEGLTTGFNDFRESHLYPSVGAGYKSGYGNWTYGFHVLLPLEDRAREFVSLEYWIDFNHKF